MNWQPIKMEPLKQLGLKTWRALTRVRWRRWFALLVLAGAVGVLSLFGAVVALSQNLPSVEQIDSRTLIQSTRIYDRTGEKMLYELSGGKKRVVVPFEDIPQHLKDATIAIEEQNFYDNPAFDWRGIARALWANFRSGVVVQGGSTITQQLAKNAFLTPERTIDRKLRELLLAIQLSRHYSKEKILWLYLNEIPYGTTIYGAGTASEAYFNKPVRDITIAEAAILAAIPRNPPFYYPWGSHTDQLFRRQQIILRRMLELGKITQEQHDQAAAEQVAFQPQTNGIEAPHFALAIQDYLVEKYGEDMVRTGGLSVITTLDWDLQEIAERVVSEGAARNEDLYQGYNAALVAQDPKTGQILAMVGSRDYNEESLPAGCRPGVNCKFEPNFNAATQALRQPGSALKPFAYLAAFEKGFLPQTAVWDVATEFVPNRPECPPVPNFENRDTRCFHPQNYDGDFKGPISLRDALAQSVNIPAVKVLYLSGMDYVLDRMREFGVSTLTDPRRYGLSLVLGGGEVKLVDMVQAYSVLAADGIRREQRLVLEVKDSRGRVLEAFRPEERRVADSQYVRMVNDILSDVRARSPLFQSSLRLTTFPDYDVALKTGTTNDYKDAWAMGYTPFLTVGVWAGNNDSVPMQRRGGSILASVPIWSAFLAEALPKFAPEAFPRPEAPSLVKPVIAGEYLQHGQAHSILYYVDRADPAGPQPANPAKDPQFWNWEMGVFRWVQERWGGTGTTDGSFVIRVDQPEAGAFVGNEVRVSAEISSPAPITRIQISFNQRVVQEFHGEFQSPHQIQLSFFPPDMQQQNLLAIEAWHGDGGNTRSEVIVYR
jgi:membrane peptidoglycan carboxypeptidase